MTFRRSFRAILYSVDRCKASVGLCRCWRCACRLSLNHCFRKLAIPSVHQKTALRPALAVFRGIVRPHSSVSNFVVLFVINSALSPFIGESVMFAVGANTIYSSSPNSCVDTYRCTVYRIRYTVDVSPLALTDLFLFPFSTISDVKIHVLMVAARILFSHMPVAYFFRLFFRREGNVGN